MHSQDYDRIQSTIVASMPTNSDLQNVGNTTYQQMQYSDPLNVTRHDSTVPQYSYNISPDAAEQEILEFACNEFLLATLAPDLEYGFESSADRILSNFRFDYPNLFLRLFTRLTLKLYGAPKRYAALLKAMGALEYADDLQDLLVTAAAAGINKDRHVQEAMLHLFESWGDKECLTILQNVQMSSDWLESYRKKVIAYIELQG